jgi:hypothetical protein
MSQTKAQLIDNLVQALNFTGTASAPANGLFLSAANTLALATNSAQRLTIDSSGNVGIGTNSPDSDSDHYALTIRGKASTGAGMLSFIDTSGNKDGFIFGDNGSLFFTADSSNATADSTIRFRVDGSSEKMRIDSSGKVGIGTTSPGQKLGVSGNIRFEAADPTLEFNNGGAMVYSRAANTLQFASGGGPSSPTERMRIDSSGRLLIGVTSASNASGNADDLCIGSTGSSGEVGITFGTTSAASIRWADAAQNSVGALEYVHSDNRMSFQTNNAERMRITGDGPHLLLGGTSDVNEITESSANAGMVIGGTGFGNAGLAIITSTSGTGRLYFGDDVGSNAGRNVGQINYGHSDNHMRFVTAGSERVRINNSGAVGIGTTNPQYKLHVLGGDVDLTARFGNSRTGDGNINYIGVSLDGGGRGVALFGHTGHSTAGSQAAWMGCAGDDVAGGTGVKAFRGGDVQMNGKLRVNTGTQYGKLHVVEGSFNPGSSNWLTEVSYVASGSFGGGYSLLDGSKGYSMYCHGSGQNFSIQHHTSTTAGATGGVQITNGATSWTSASDERDKENLVTISDAITKIKTLRTVIGNYTWQPDKKHAFLIAQDVQAVLPEAVDITHTYKDLENQRLGLRYTEVIPLLTAALQEEIAKREALETRIAALETA